MWANLQEGGLRVFAQKIADRRVESDGRCKVRHPILWPQSGGTIDYIGCDAGEKSSLQTVPFKIFRLDLCLDETEIFGSERFHVIFGFLVSG